MGSIQAFDWHRLFLGETGSVYLTEVAFRTLVMYCYAVVFSRFIGKRGVGQVSPFELVVIIIVSSAAGVPMFDPKVPLLHGIVVLTVTMTLHRLLGTLTDRSARVEEVTEGRPLLIIEQGEIVERAVGTTSLSHRELLMKLRERGIRDVGEVERAFFEPSGHVSVFPADPGRVRQTLSTMPERQSVHGPS